jgi:ATP-dependent helicase/nuclease subunit B
MAVRFVLGRSGAGKTAWCLRAIIDSLVSEGEDGPGLVFLVPEQATWQAERAILADHRIAGYGRLRVVSFDRLMFHLLGAGAGLEAGAEISRLGQQMVVHKVLRERAEQLGTFGRTARAAGLASEVARTLVEFQEYEQTPEDVRQVAEAIERERPGHPAAGKFADLAAVYGGYLEFLERHSDVFVNPDARLTAVRQRVQGAAWLAGVRLWVDGFSSFTVQQRALLVELLKVAGEAWIALCLDPAAFDYVRPTAEEIDPADLFAGTRRTYAELWEAVVKCKLPLEEPVILGEGRRWVDMPALEHVERHISVPGAEVRASADGAVRILAAAGARAEAEWIAREIVRLVREERRRYRDIAVVVSDIGAYEHYFEAAFGEYGVPFFVDRPRPAGVHPVVELVTAGLQAALGGFASGDVFAFLKTGLAGVEAEDVARLENYGLAHGVSGADWVRQAAWDYAAGCGGGDDEAAIDAIRRRAVRPLVRLREALRCDDGQAKGGGITAEAFVQAVWGCLELLGVREKLAAWCEDDAEDAMGHRQFFAKFVAVVDEMCAVFAGDVMGAEDFAAILAAALGQLTLKLVPSRLDQVLVGTIERSRHPDLAVVFLAGATQKSFPLPVRYDAVLTDEDREMAEGCGVELADRLSRQLAARQYLAYIAFTRAASRLYVTWPTMDAEGRPVARSSFVDQLAGLFGDVRVEACDEGISHAGELYGLRQLTGLLCERLGRDWREADKRRELLAEVWRGMAGAGDAGLRAAAERVRRALAYDNRATLAGEVCGRLVGECLESSVTRLGAFAACPFRHFAQYLLGLDSRKLFRFEPVDVGQFYHRVLDEMFRAMQDAGKDWATVEAEEAVAICRQVVARVFETNAFLANFRRRGAHNAYILDAAARTIEECVPALAEMARAGRFRQCASELRFGVEDEGEGLVCRFALRDGRKVSLRGSIDRVDAAEWDGQRVALIFDYKRRGQSVSWSELYHGLDMQLGVYMLALEGASVGEAAVDAVAGAFFLPVEVGPTTETLSELDDKRERFRYKAKGIVDGRYAGLLCAELGRGWNRYYNFGVDKDGGPYNNFRRSAALRSEEFRAVLEGVRRRIVAFAEGIVGGQIEVRPYRMGGKSPCSRCDYGALCRFDWQVNDYAPLELLGKEEVLARMGGGA